jgi:hypothetical protein
MSYDDQKYTAYALNELDANECAEIERAILAQPQANAEIAETREMAGILRETLKTETAPALCEHHRDAIFRAASIAGKASRPPLENVVAHAEPAWWQRVGFWQLATACLVFSFGAYAIGTSLGGGEKNRMEVARASDGQKVQIGNLAANDSAQSETGPSFKVPAQSPQLGAPTIATHIDVVQTTPSGVVSVPNDLANKLQPSAPSRPQVVDPNDPLASFRARADIGKKVPARADTQSSSSSLVGPQEQVVLRSDHGEVKLSGDEANRYFSVREYLDARWREASSLHEGSSYAELSRIFRHESYADGVHRFVMVRCPSIKVGVSFVTKENKEPEWPMPKDAKIRTITQPYFEPERGN